MGYSQRSLTGTGGATYARVLEARREGLCELLEGWAPEKHDDVMALVERLAKDLVTEAPEVRAEPVAAGA